MLVSKIFYMLKGNNADFPHKSLLTWGVLLHMQKLRKAFCGSRHLICCTHTCSAADNMLQSANYVQCAETGQLLANNINSLTR